MELERAWFEENNYEFKTIFIWFLFDYDNPYPTHTYLIYKNKDNNKWCMFEHSDFNNKGIYEFDTYKDVINFQKNNFINYTKGIIKDFKEEDIEHLRIYEYNHPKFGCNMEEFLDNIINNGKEIEGEKNGIKN